MLHKNHRKNITASDRLEKLKETKTCAYLDDLLQNKISSQNIHLIDSKISAVCKKTMKALSPP